MPLRKSGVQALGDPHTTGMDTDDPGIGLDIAPDSLDQVVEQFLGVRKWCCHWKRNLQVSSVPPPGQHMLSAAGRECRHRAASRKLPHDRRQGVFRAVSIDRQPDNEQHRLPLPDQRFDQGQWILRVTVVQSCQWVRNPEFTVTNCNTDAALTKIERHHRAAVQGVCRFARRGAPGLSWH